MALCSEKLEANDMTAAYSCALNAVLCNPQIPDYYGSAVLLGLQTGQNDTATTILNEGLWAFPQSGELNYIAATLKAAEGDNESAKAFLQTAMADTEMSAAYKQKCQALQAEIGG
jgi:Tfp pilus assembly protein PilF